MTKLTEEAKEEYGLWVRFRLRLASFVVGIGFTLMPREYWEDVQKEELRQIARRFDDVTVEWEGDDGE